MNKVDEINIEISKLDDKSLISDGSHNFGELYYHRMMLFSIICNSNLEKAWKAWQHDDGTMFENYFIVGIDTPEGQFSYHYHKDYWHYFNNVQELKYAPKWDGHTSQDITRLLGLVQRSYM